MDFFETMLNRVGVLESFERIINLGNDFFFKNLAHGVDGLMGSDLDLFV